MALDSLHHRALAAVCAVTSAGAQTALGERIMAFVDVQFQSMAPDQSVECAIYRWVARLEAIKVAVARARVTVEALGSRRVMACLTIVLMDGSVRAADTIQPDVYLALEEAFRSIKRQTRQPAVAARPRLLASA